MDIILETYRSSPPALANAADAAGSPRVCAPRTSVTLRSVMRSRSRTSWQAEV